MSQSIKSERQAAPFAEPAQRRRRHAISRLDPMMACDAAFRIVARRYFEDLTANHDATCRGNSTALHQMRIALTRLRTAILFFSPMVADTEQARIKDELKWLHRHLGVVRDLDVAIERLRAANRPRAQAMPDYRHWAAKRADSHRRLARALRSARYRRLIKSASGWIENGPWSIRKGKQAAKERASPIAVYSPGKLMRWQERLLKKSHKLRNMSAKKRHRLRLLNKRLCYSTEFFEDLFRNEGLSRQRAALKYLRKAQKSLGQLNDDANGRSLAATLQRGRMFAPLPFLGPKGEKRLIRRAATAYRKLAALKPVRV